MFSSSGRILRRYPRIPQVRGGADRSLHSQRKYRVTLAVGTNLGDRLQHLQQALRLLPAQVLQTSFLYQTDPMYVTDQPVFWNGAVLVETDCEPLEFLDSIKRIEAELGRNLQSGLRNGPRPIDLDVLYYQTDDDVMMQLNLDNLTIPHPRIAERDFVLQPLMDLLGPDFAHDNVTCLGELWKPLRPLSTAVRILPLRRGRAIVFNETIVMGILNVTPDSFSDGGTLHSVEDAVQRALEMEQQGARIIDIGGESTRPGAKEIAVEEELQRVLPVIEGIRKCKDKNRAISLSIKSFSLANLPLFVLLFADSDIPISIDTRHSKVARSAIEAGADIVNDVSGGQFDPNMMATVAELGVPILLMHMRGTPETMMDMTTYSDVVADVAQTLKTISQQAQAAGIHRWNQVVDPGIGFAKDFHGNLYLLQQLARIRSTVGQMPILLGTSRKGFIGKATGVEKSADRDPGSIASCIASLCLDESMAPCNLLRVHNVPDFVQACRVMDAIRNVKVDK